MQTQPDEEDEDSEYFTANARDQRFLSIKQASKIDYYRKENEQLKEQIQHLETNLYLNKELLAVTEADTINQISSADPQSEILTRLKGYQEREAELQRQNDALRVDRDSNQAQILGFQQMMADQKQNENEHVKELYEQIEDLKHKLDKTEYIIQYKEKIWTYLEREISKVVH